MRCYQSIDGQIDFLWTKKSRLSLCLEDAHLTFASVEQLSSSYRVSQSRSCYGISCRGVFSSQVEDKPEMQSSLSAS